MWIISQSGTGRNTEFQRKMINRAKQKQHHLGVNIFISHCTNKNIKLHWPQSKTLTSMQNLLHTIHTLDSNRCMHVDSVSGEDSVTFDWALLPRNYSHRSNPEHILWNHCLTFFFFSFLRLDKLLLQSFSFVTDCNAFRVIACFSALCFMQ